MSIGWCAIGSVGLTGRSSRAGADAGAQPASARRRAAAHRASSHRWQPRSCVSRTDGDPALSAQFVFGRRYRGRAGARRAAATARAYRYSFDMLGEAALTAQDAQRYLLRLRAAIHAVGAAYRGRGPVAGGSVSVKLSALHPRYGYAQHERVHARTAAAAAASWRDCAQHYDIALAIDAEEADRLELSLDLIEALMARPRAGGLGRARRCGAGLSETRAGGDRLSAGTGSAAPRAAHGAAGQGRLLGCRNQAARRWRAWPAIRSTRARLYTDVAYLACARRLLAARAQVMPQFATHNAQTVADDSASWRRTAGAGDYEFQCLYGMGAALYRQLLQLARDRAARCASMRRWARARRCWPI